MPRISTDNYDTVASWNGLQDLFIVEQPDGTKVATPAMVKQYVLGNSIDDIYSVMGQNGAKNLIPYPYYHTSKTTAGITITDNGDGTLTFNGTSTSATVIFRLTSNDVNIEIPLNKSKYILTWINSSEHNPYFRMVITLVKSDDTTIIVDGKSGIINIDNTNGEYKGISGMSVNTANNQTVSNLTFKPMLRLASDTDNTYQPYAKTNKQLTEDIDDVPTQNSNNPVKSSGIKTYVDNAVSGLIKVAHITGTTSANGNMQLTGLSKANAIVLGCQFLGANNACVVAIPYIYSALNTGNWGVHCLMESGPHAIAANMDLQGYVYYIDKRAYTS